jgi:P27 family predicted phage terminase small subunit
VNREKIPAPEHLTEKSKALWEQIVDENEIDAVAAKILLTLCDAMERRDEARKVIAERGITTLDRFNVLKVNPALAIERDSTLIMHRAFRLLGFDQEPRGEQQGKLAF